MPKEHLAALQILTKACMEDAQILQTVHGCCLGNGWKTLVFILYLSATVVKEIESLSYRCF
jgi:hypothetical protein